MLNLFWQVVGAIGGTTAILAIMGWLIKLIISHSLSRDIEKYKNDLKTTSERQLEQARAQLRVDALEREVRFRSLHEKVAEAVDTIFQAMSNLHSSLEIFAFSLEFEPNRRQETAKCLSEASALFKDAYRRWRLFLPSSLYSHIKKFDDLVFSTSMKYVHATTRDTLLVDGPADEWQRAKNMLNNEIEPLLELIHSDFQRLLGYPDILK